MKIRTDFVTNSSSSSFFILTLKTKHGTYQDELDDAFCGGLTDDCCKALLKANSIDTFINKLSRSIKPAGKGWFGDSVTEGLKQCTDITDILEFEYDEFTSAYDEMERSDGDYIRAKLDFVNKRFEYSAGNETRDSEDDIVVPDGVTEIEYQQFEHYSMKRIKLPETLTEINDRAFFGCSNLQEITIPAGVTRIGDDAFYGCSSLTSVKIPQSVKSIGCSAFCDCSSLNNVTIPEGVTEICSWTFRNCSSLMGVTIPKGVTKIEQFAFSDCSNLTSVTIPEGVTEIGEFAFSDCRNLQQVIIPNSVTSIGRCAFYGCHNLRSIRLPDALTEIAEGAFSACNGLADENGFLIVKNTLYGYCGSAQNVEIPDNVTLIDSFHCRPEVTSVTIPNSVTMIRGHAFRKSEGLKSITIPSSITELYNCTFKDCINLESITIPASVTKMRDPFGGCEKLTTIYGVPRSYAEQYAKRTKRQFIPIAAGSDATVTNTQKSSRQTAKKAPVSDNQNTTAKTPQAQSSDRTQTAKKANVPAPSTEASNMLTAEIACKQAELDALTEELEFLKNGGDFKAMAVKQIEEMLAARYEEYKAKHVVSRNRAKQIRDYAAGINKKAAQMDANLTRQTDAVFVDIRRAGIQDINDIGFIRYQSRFQRILSQHVRDLTELFMQAALQMESYYKECLSQNLLDLLIDMLVNIFDPNNTEGFTVAVNGTVVARAVPPKECRDIIQNWQTLSQNFPKDPEEVERAKEEAAQKALTQKKSQIEKRIASLKKEIAQCPDNLKRYQAEIKRCTAALEQARNRYDSDCAAIEKRSNAKEADLESKLAAAQKRKSKLEAQRSDLESRLAQTFVLAFGKKKELKTQISDVNADLAKVDYTAGSLRGSLDSLKADRKKELAALDSAIASYEKQIQDAEAQIVSDSKKRSRDEAAMEKKRAELELVNQELEAFHVNYLFSTYGESTIDRDSLIAERTKRAEKLQKEIKKLNREQRAALEAAESSAPVSAPEAPESAPAPKKKSASKASRANDNAQKPIRTSIEMIAPNGKLSGLFVAQVLLGKDLMFFNPDEIVFENGHHALRGMQFNAETVSNIPLILENAQFFANGLAQCLMTVEENTNLICPISKIDPVLHPYIRDEDLTGITWMDLFAYHLLMVIVLEDQCSENEMVYNVAADTRILNSVPNSHEIIRELITELHRYDGDERSVRVIITGMRNFDV